MKQYVVDAFTDRVFGGNPAAVCVMEQWLPEETMMSITKENNLSETAFAVREGDVYRLRWFTPGGEIDLCGHATLATAYVISRLVDKESSEIRFATLSGELKVIIRGDLFELDFPAYELRKLEITDQMKNAAGTDIEEAYIGRDLMFILKSEAEVRNFKPDFKKISELEGLLLHVTAKGSEHDCVSRSFAPKLNVPEDPVCGSGHCHIIPYWAQKLSKRELVAYQASERGGTLYCTMDGDRVKLSGKAVLYSEADIFISEEV